jgi:hypothetical protein
MSSKKPANGGNGTGDVPPDEAARKAEEVLRKMLNTPPDPRRKKGKPQDAKEKVGKGRG